MFIEYGTKTVMYFAVGNAQNENTSTPKAWLTDKTIY